MIILDKSNIDQIEINISPPMSFAVTIPVMVDDIELVLYIGNSVFGNQEPVLVKRAIAQLARTLVSSSVV